MLLTRPKRPSKAYLAAFLVTASTVFAGLIFLPDDPYIRYQMVKGTIFDGLVWDYERIQFDPTPIDIAILGNSRSGAGINSPMLEELLSSQVRRLRTVNLSIPGAGFDIQYSLAKRLLEKKSPRILLISLADQIPRDGHQTFADIADPNDVVQAPLFLNRQFARNIAYLPMRQLRALYWAAFPESRGYSKGWNEPSYAGANPDFRKLATGTPRNPLSIDDEEELKSQSVKARSRITKPFLPGSLHGIEFGAGEYYLDQIIKSAERKNVKVFFLYLPFYLGFDKPLDHEWLSSRGTILSAKFLSANVANYCDCNHASYSGSELVTRWLADELNAVLQASEKR